MEESCHITENMIVMSWLLAKSDRHIVFLCIGRMAGSVFFPVEKTEFYLQIVDVAETKNTKQFKNADVIVAGIHTYPSEWQEIIHNFTVRHKKVLYLVEGYALHASRLKTDMMDRYRIAPEQIGYIPQNGELEWVSAQGKIDNFMKSWRQKSRTERNENFFEEMEHNLFLLMKQMEKMKMEDINYGTGNETLWKCNSCGNRIIGIRCDHCGGTVVGRICCNGI